jgi:FdhD protein
MRVLHLDAVPEQKPPTVLGTRISAEGSQPVAWHLAEEAAIAFLINGQSFAVMMATPADLDDFALGFLLTERIILKATDLDEVRILPVEDGYALNCIVPTAAAEAADKRRRTLTGRSGCGLCGAETLEAALPSLPRVAGVIPDPKTVLAALKALPTLQPLNAVNHSTHAAGFFSADGKVSLVREDVGRHNALDKLGGALVRQGIDPASGFAVLSSRMSVEMVQKAVILGLPFLASVSAPTELALRVARRAGLKVCAQSRDGLVFFETTGTP